MSVELWHRRPVARGIVLLGGLAAAVRFGFNYGIGNHNTYLLHALRLVDPRVLAHDWLATIGADYHPVFTRLAAVLIGLDGSGWLIALANVVSVAGGMVAVFLIIRALTEPPQSLLVSLIVGSLVTVGSTYSIAGSYLFSMTFQPSTVSAVGLLFALALYVRTAFVLSGVVLAAAGAFHVNYLVLAFPLFGLAHVLLGRERLSGRLLAQLAPSIVPLLLLTPLLIGQTESSNAEYARYIFQQIQAPQHYQPMTFLHEFITYGAWCGLGILAGWRIMSSSQTGRRLRAIWLATLILVTAGTLLTTIVYIPLVSQVYVWRLAPLTVLISQIVASVGLVTYLIEGRAVFSWSGRIVVFIIAAVLIGLTFRYHYGEFRMTQAWMLGALAVAFLLCPAITPWGPRLRAYVGLSIIVGVWVFGSAVAVLSMPSRSSLITGLPSGERELYEWAVTTPDSAVFLIPPRLDNFRFNARRAVIVDTKSTPVDPDRLVEWYDRLQVVSGIDGVSGREEAVAGYRELDSMRVEYIHALYPFDYVITSSDQSFSGGRCFMPVFENQSFRVFARTGQ